jgi:SsrA-binding protein
MVENRKAYFEYNILEKYTTGMVLIGSEIKSIRDGNTNISDAYCILIDGEMFVRNMYVAPYDKAQTPHEPRRDRKLLLTKQELKRIGNKMIDKGLTIVPLKLEIDKLIKMEIGIGKGKKLFDKRESIKNKDIKRDLERNNN